MTYEYRIEYADPPTHGTIYRVKYRRTHNDDHRYESILVQAKSTIQAKFIARLHFEKNTHWFKDFEIQGVEGEPVVRLSDVVPE